MDRSERAVIVHGDPGGAAFPFAGMGCKSNTGCASECGPSREQKCREPYQATRRNATEMPGGEFGGST